MLNKAQRMVADTYGGGDYYHIVTLDQAREADDGLFTFLMIELDDKEGCDTIEEAQNRVCSAIRDLEQVLRTLEKST